MSRGHYVKHWCFTINNYNEDDVTALSSLHPSEASYIIFGRERGENGTPHLQGYIEFVKRERLTSIKKIPSLSRAHLEPRRGTPEAAAEYCRKDGEVVELGECSRDGGQLGDRLVEARALALTGAPESDLALRSDYIRYRRNIHESITAERQYETRQRLAASISSAALRPWQQEVLTLITAQPDHRKVYWYYDSKGGTGKTWFSRYCVLLHDAIRYENGKSTDIKHAYGGQPVVIFDFSRSQQEHLNYEVIESIKNGLFFSPKYDSQFRIYDIPHVIAFANFLPDTSKLSQDRWDVRDITDYDTPAPLFSLFLPQRNKQV